MISPQGYLLGKDPKAKNPFWNEGETDDVERIFATATVDDNSGTPQVQTTKSISGNNITFGFNFRNLKGRPGQDGTPGADGYSPSASVRSVANGSEITITDRNGTTRSVVQNGAPGTPGVSPIANVIPTSNGARITITDANGTTEADIENGEPGTPGTPGEPGAPGADGVTPNVTATATVGSGSGTPSVDVTRSGSDANPVLNFAFDNLKGSPGQDGSPGRDGVSPTARVEQIQGQNAAKLIVTDANGTTEATLTGEAGPPGAPGQDGSPGATGATPDITATATIGSGTGTPSVNVTKSGTAENPVLNFAFDNLKGADGTPGSPGAPGQDGSPGATGATPDITATATIGSGSGTPSVNVTKSGTAENPVLNFAFDNLKGQDGQGGGTQKLKLLTTSITASTLYNLLSQHENEPIFVCRGETNATDAYLTVPSYTAYSKTVTIPTSGNVTAAQNSAATTYVEMACGWYRVRRSNATTITLEPMQTSNTKGRTILLVTSSSVLVTKIGRDIFNSSWQNNATAVLTIASREVSQVAVSAAQIAMYYLG